MNPNRDGSGAGDGCGEEGNVRRQWPIVISDEDSQREWVLVWTLSCCSRLYAVTDSIVRDYLGTTMKLVSFQSTGSQFSYLLLPLLTALDMHRPFEIMPRVMTHARDVPISRGRCVVFLPCLDDDVLMLLVASARHGPFILNQSQCPFNLQLH